MAEKVLRAEGRLHWTGFTFAGGGKERIFFVLVHTEYTASGFMSKTFKSIAISRQILHPTNWLKCRLARKF